MTREDFELLGMTSRAAKAALDASIGHLDSTNAVMHGFGKDVHGPRWRSARRATI